jgi:hypothetical protein|tara:strand:- start:530 stop:676 length:147 start_codon:yes stop_codon:yes gene_type:complete
VEEAVVVPVLSMDMVAVVVVLVNSWHLDLLPFLLLQNQLLLVVVVLDG